jgi:hypothetical protein
MIFWTVTFTFINIAVTIRDFFDGPTWSQSVETITATWNKHRRHPAGPAGPAGLTTLEPHDLTENVDTDTVDDWE